MSCRPLDDKAQAASTLEASPGEAIIPKEFDTYSVFWARQWKGSCDQMRLLKRCSEERMINVKMQGRRKMVWAVVRCLVFVYRKLQKFKVGQVEFGLASDGKWRMSDGRPSKHSSRIHWIRLP